MTPSTRLSALGTDRWMVRITTISTIMGRIGHDLRGYLGLGRLGVEARSAPPPRQGPAQDVPAGRAVLCYHGFRAQRTHRPPVHHAEGRPSPLLHQQLAGVRGLGNVPTRV